MTSYGLDEWYWAMFKPTWTLPIFTFGQHFMLIEANSDTSSMGPSNKDHPFCQIKCSYNAGGLKDLGLLQWQIIWDISQWFYKNQISCLDGLVKHATLYTAHSITCIMFPPSQQSVQIKCFCCLSFSLPV